MGDEDRGYFQYDVCKSLFFEVRSLSVRELTPFRTHVSDTLGAPSSLSLRLFVEPSSGHLRFAPQPLVWLFELFDSPHRLGELSVLGANHILQHQDERRRRSDELVLEELGDVRWAGLNLVGGVREVGAEGAAECRLLGRDLGQLGNGGFGGGVSGFGLFVSPVGNSFFIGMTRVGTSSSLLMLCVLKDQESSKMLRRMCPRNICIMYLRPWTHMEVPNGGLIEVCVMQWRASGLKIELLGFG
ncbi:hypothetical protein BT93_L2238 [Corymbia citriodora subsp. variegata]|uniref:Uncharacterized protein n=1 Tax=Corymbia citriodora subsp. variegata TaxID=360336 RepID=A0A8T0CKF1_CORYI|nr:hypothetical protein BT93_L2238 [Corymbia citriodora subsp. variegata]